MLLTHFFPRNAAFSYEALRAAGYANFGGADVGEVAAVCARIQSGDEVGWQREWQRAGERAAAQAERSSAAGNVPSAADALLRASNYFRTAEFFRRDHDDPARDPVAQDLSDRACACFVRAMEITDACVMDEVQIPYEAGGGGGSGGGGGGTGSDFSTNLAAEPIAPSAAGTAATATASTTATTLPAYFFSPDRSGVKRATIVFNGGFDSTKEEAWFAIAAAGVRRGYNVLAFDGPGQGAALRKQGLVFRADWERVVSAVVDYAVGRGDVDGERVVLFGWSMGAYLVARAATAEHRAAALVLDDGVFDFGAAFRDPQPRAFRYLIDNGYDLLANPILEVLKTATSTGDRWALLNGKWTFGARSEAEFLRMVNEYTLEGRAQDIRTPCLILDAPEDHFLKGQPRLLESKLTCDKTFVSLTASEGGETHCHMGAFGRLHQVIFDYLAERLKKR